ncbi:MAG TPA: hypothetical protein VMU11_03960 [Verrucomicrobiae bacterium]|nr:hypothetical protein [Verrucomicrobiae bacterium]
MRHFITILSLVSFMGCAGGSAVATDPVLVIERDPVLNDLTVTQGASDAELLRFDVENISARDVQIRSLLAGLSHPDWSSLPSGTVSDIKFTDATGRVIMGPQNLDGVHDGIEFQEPFVLHAGETVTLVLSADIGATAGQILVSVGGFMFEGGTLPLPPPRSLQDHLIFDAVFTDNGERVPVYRIDDNCEIARIVNVVP